MNKRLLLLLGTILVMSLSMGSAYAAPRLTIPDTDFNFGNVPQNAKIAHVFWLHSTGDDSLLILKVVPG